MGWQSHHPPLAERFAPPPEPVDPTPAEAMAHRLKTSDGKKPYALRKQTPEPVFGIIKSVLGFCGFLLRNLENVSNEWRLVTIAWTRAVIGVSKLELRGADGPVEFNPS